MALDSVEKRTWAQVCIRVGGRTVTQVSDPESETVRSAIYVPAFALADWIARNWWALLYEPLRYPRVLAARGASSLAEREWTLRHCARAADAGLLLPRLFLYNDGRGVVAEWSDDRIGEFPHMPGRFVEPGRIRLDVEEAQAGLMEFMTEVATRLKGYEDERVSVFRNNWNAILSADAEEHREEHRFCKATGIMGIDPYELTGVSETLLQFIESDLELDDTPSIETDLLEVTRSAETVATWEWVSRTREAHGLGGSAIHPSLNQFEADLPHDLGYQTAQAIREASGAQATAPIRDLSEIADRVGKRHFTLVDHNHLPSSRIKGMVGETREDKTLIVGPAPERANSRRFLEARALYHALATCRSGPRLITAAQTWDQQASRAFAAEFLAPHSALESRVDEASGTEDSTDLVESLASEFEVSPWLIEHQLFNFGISFLDR